MSYAIWIDDERACPTWFQANAKTTNDGLNIIRKKYKEGIREFYLDLDHDAGDVDNQHGGDFINILKTLDTLIYTGKIKANFKIHLHTGNTVGRANMQAIINANPNMVEV